MTNSWLASLHPNPKTKLNPEPQTHQPSQPIPTQPSQPSQPIPTHPNPMQLNPPSRLPVLPDLSGFGAPQPVERSPGVNRETLRWLDGEFLLAQTYSW